MRTYNVITAALAALFIMGLGLLGHSEAQAATYAPSVSDYVYSTDTIFPLWSQCEAGTIGYMETVIIMDDGTVAGDQDGNGIIDGDDCNWR